MIDKVKLPEKAQQVRVNSMGWMVKSLSTRLDKQMLKQLKAYGLNLGQFAIIMVLLEKEGLTQADIGQQLLMPAYATTRNIDYLVKKEYLKRHINECSRRSFCIRLTKKGKALSSVLFPIIETTNETLLAPLCPDEIIQLNSILAKLLAEG